jgi:predicted Zn finger-like uncharacterized protein
MKFSCQSCRTRYDIKDEKVRGKRLRIRCRKCQALVEVDGRGLPAPKTEAAAASDDEGGTTRMMPAPQLQRVLAETRPDEPSAAGDDQDTTRMMSIADLERERRKARAGDDRAGDEVDSAGKTTPPPPALVEAEQPSPEPAPRRTEDDGGWHAVIAREQRGPFTRTELEVEVAAGRITERTYVWRESLGDWRPARDVDALAGLFTDAQAPPLPAPAPPPPSPTAPEPRVSGRSTFLDEDDVAAGAGPDDDLLNRDGLGGLFEGLPGSPDPEDDVEPGPATGADPLMPGARGGLGDGDAFSAALGEPVAADDRDVDSPPRETTQAFIQASGVRRQRSPLRILAFVLAFLGVFAGLGYLVSVAAGVDLSGLAPASSERREAQAWESSGGDEAFRERMLGLSKDEAPEPEASPASRRRTTKSGAETDGERRVRERREAEIAAVGAEQRESLADLYEGGDRGTISVRSRRRDAAGGDDGPGVAFDAENLHRRLAENQSAFENCVQQELRRNPRFRGGRVEMTLTVAPSGVITGATLADRTLDRSEVGRCLTRAARRMMLQSFPGEDPIDVVVPLVLSAAL